LASAIHLGIMVKAITLERWQQAQVAERKLHDKTLEEGKHHYRIAYSNNFRYLNIDPTNVKNIIEIGCADFPALLFCDPLLPCAIVEPMPSSILKRICENTGITLYTETIEQLDPLYIYGQEAWLFNVLQHTIDPEEIIETLQTYARCIRYFEPIDTAITDYHPHSFTKDDFDRWFPGVNKYYNETTNACFHDGPCCYGVWNNPNNQC